MGFGSQSGPSNGAIGDHNNSTHSSYSGCFVATACYGQHSIITDSLRNWRDIELAGSNKFKKLFILLYYSIWGKPGGRLLRKFPFLQPLARKAILLFIKFNGIKIKTKY